MMGRLIVVVLFLLIDLTLSSNASLDYPSIWNEVDVCPTEPRGRVPWILHRRKSDYGWGGHTHRAIIALAVNGYRPHDQSDWIRMDLQLEVEIAGVLLRSPMETIHENELALFIHALVARNKNPRDFYGIDLVAELLARVNGCIASAECKVHPYLVLALCNSHAVDYDHLYVLKEVAEHRQDLETREQIEMKALALKAFACAKSLDTNLNKFTHEMNTIVKCLHSKQKDDGSFGNAYTTALAVQALMAYDDGRHWKMTEALGYLLKEAEIDVNMIKAYYIEMALNADRVKFIKDLSNVVFESPQSQTDDRNTHYVIYTVKKEEYPDIYSTITIKVPKSYNFFQIMERCAEENEKYFRFKYYSNKEGDPVIYSVAGIPNDAEEDLFWRLCEQKNVEHLNHTSVIEGIHASPKKFFPTEDSHVTFWYRNSNCPAYAGWENPFVQ